MSAIQLSSNERGGYTLLVDGVDISDAVLASSVSLRFEVEKVGPTRAVLSVDLAAHVLDVDLPEVVVEAARVAEEDFA